MLTKRLFNNFKQLRTSQQVFNNTIRAFSAEANENQESAQVPEPTQEEIAAGREQWGVQYDDECLKFEKEWQMIAEKVEQEQMVFVEQELGDLQKEKVKKFATR